LVAQPLKLGRFVSAINIFCSERTKPPLGSIAFAPAITSAVIVALPKNSALLHRTARVRRSRNLASEIGFV
jgi:hypothetical protein